MPDNRHSTTLTGLEIAVIGMAGRFPGAGDIDEFWDNLTGGVESISFFSDKELEESGVDTGLIKKTNYVKALGVLEDKEYFDPSFFGYSLLEAEVMNPQIRIFHECTWSALEDAGYDPVSYDGMIGLYAGASSRSYWETLVLLSGKTRTLGRFASSQLAEKDYLCSRISYNLNLKGTSSIVQTACSTSLFAIHQACRSLLTGECKMVLAGGVSISSSSKRGYIYREGMIMSPDGHCRAFDAKAKGTVGGEGAAVVVLKRLKNAAADRDNIYAVIKGSAINNDGKRKVGFAAPSVEGQAEVIKTAQRLSRVEPGSISYIEAHGTGTPLGDPVEFEALKLAFNTSKKGFCALGSVKTNFGHLDAAAGAAGFIKTALALKHKLIPPSLSFENPNPNIDLKNSPFYVNTGLKEWKNGGMPLRAGVSSFGIGGTNVHVVLEEWTGEAGPAAGGFHSNLILLSAATGTALERMTKNLADHFKKKADINLDDAAYTLQVGRRSRKHRRMLVCSDINEAVEALSNNDPGKVRIFEAKENTGPVVFMFPGQGAQYVNMGAGIYRAESIFRQETDRCFEILKPIMGFDLKEILFRDSASGRPEPPKNFDDKKQRINQTSITQPLIFVVEYALAKLLMSWGITPYAMTGHSIGEYTAACISGVFSLDDALKLVALRGKLMQEMPGGAMLSVNLSEKELKPLLNKEISLAAVNSSSLCVVSGPHKVIENFEKELQKNGHESRMLYTSHAFHSKMMNPILEKFKEAVKQTKIKKPEIPYISNLTGRWITAAEATDPGYWVKHLRNTVLFSPGLQELFKKEGAIFLEVGPGKSLSTFVRQHTGKKSGQNSLNLIRHPREQFPDIGYLLDKIGHLWLFGKQLDWSRFYRRGKRYRISLPTYSFDRQRYWIDDNQLNNNIDIFSEKSKPGKRLEIADWFYVPSWKRSESVIPKMADTPIGTCTLVFNDESSLGPQLVDKLEERGHCVIIVKAGKAFTSKKKNNADEVENVFVIDPREYGNYELLFEELQKSGRVPTVVVHLWNVTRDVSYNIEEIKKIQDSGFYSLFNIARALGKHKISQKIRIIAVTNNMQEVTGEEVLCPVKATLLGAIKVIPKEYPNISCRCIDIILPTPGAKTGEKLIKQLVTELTVEYPDIETIAAYRGNHRWVQFFERVHPEKKQPPSRLREKGVYLITGGLGGIGLVLAEYLAKTVRARLILTGRSDFPSRENWGKRQDTHLQEAEAGSITGKIRKLQELEKIGAKVLALRADAADMGQMKQVITTAEKRFGKINGIIHSAGIPGGGVIRLRPPELTEHVFAPKVVGTLVLENIFKDAELDFFILCSSLSSITSPAGQIGYCAANSFLDAFAHYKMSKNETFTTSVNWDTWQEVGMAVDSVKRLTGNRDIADPGLLLEHGILPAEGVEAFSRILEFSQPQVVVCTRDLNFLLSRHQASHTSKEKESRVLEALEKRTHPKHLQQRPELSTQYAGPRDKLEQILSGIWQEYFGIEQVGIYDDFFELGGDSLKGMSFVNKYNKLFQEIVHVNIMFDAPTIAELADYFREHYPGAVARISGTGAGKGEKKQGTKIDAALIAGMRQLIPAVSPGPRVKTKKNKPAIFVLSPPRSGTTLLRVMLAGHPKLFAPPELGLLFFNNLDEINVENQASIRAIMQIKECSAGEAKAIIQEFQEQHMTTKHFYHTLQDWLGDRILVDKTPNYSLHPEVLERTEADFENPLYIHLLRHPYGMIRSFDEAKIDLLRGRNILHELSL
ncbi:MAG: SDR family NAD(P)-dependent oxidoreductase, partial [Candidatus Aminicenantes bacterium]|nr:SDR family NAD(P)-dependent oxidoreductase [Candidatus Aminicenantes bacterium]